MFEGQVEVLKRDQESNPSLRKQIAERFQMSFL
jgi:hypothetical protein